MAFAASLVNWFKRNLVVVAGLLTLAYLLLPNVVVTVFSFNRPNGRFNYEWQQFSTDAWKDPCGVAGLCGSLSLSLQIALWATLCATALGTAIAFALVRYRFRARGAINSLIFLPMAMPEVVMAASLLTLFLNMGAQLGFWTILIAHIMFCLSFVVTAVKARVLSMDPRLEQAAQDLYAGPLQTFLRVTLPIAAPGIAGPRRPALPAGHAADRRTRHRGGCAARLRALFRRFHHHQFQRGFDRHLPDVRLGIGPARNARSDQCRRHGHVRRRRTVRPGRHGRRQPQESPQGMKRT